MKGSNLLPSESTNRYILIWMFQYNPISDALYGYDYRFLLVLNDKLYDKLIWHALQIKAAEYSVNYNLFLSLKSR